MDTLFPVPQTKGSTRPQAPKMGPKLPMKKLCALWATPPSSQLQLFPKDGEVLQGNFAGGGGGSAIPWG